VNPYLSGNFAPVADERTDLALPVTGSIPRELRGRLVRIGPNPVEAPDPGRYHWFIGNGMVHGLRLCDGRAAWYRRRFVRDDQVTAARGWPRAPGPRRGTGRNIANTHVLAHAGRLFAVVESGALPVEIDGGLETVGTCDFDGTLPAGFTAHAKRDPATGELHAVAYSWEWDHIQYLVVGRDARVRRAVNVAVPGKPMTHDCAITQRYVVVFDLPVTFDPGAAAERPLPYRFDPAYGARVGLLPREGDASQIRWLEVPLCYVFHAVSAHDTPDGRVVLCVVRHAAMLEDDVYGVDAGGATLERWTLDPATGKVTAERLDDRGQEFPRHDDRRTGCEVRYAYTVALANGPTFGPLYKHDLARGTSETHDEGATRMFLEPVFVPRTPEAAEDDGFLLAFVYDAASRRSEVVILHAQDFRDEPLATIHLPVRVPFGFHGTFVPDEA
jgi:carotenoid cleavage dioxygenase